MSDQTPPPKPGTSPSPADNFAPELHRYRPHPAIWELERSTGVSQLPDDELEARVDAQARGIDPDQLNGRAPAVAEEIAEAVDVRVAASAGEHAESRAEAVGALAAGELAVEQRERNLRSAIVEERTAHAEMPDEPAFGTAFTRRMLLLVPLPLLVYLELKFTAATISVGLPDSSDRGAAWVAGGVATVLTLAAEGAALFLGARLARAGRRAVHAVGAAVAVALVGLCVWTVVAIAGSRETNVAYRDSLKPPPAATSGGSFGVSPAGSGAAPARPGGFAPAQPAQPGAATADAAAPAGPDLGFVVPVTLLALTLGMALSLRCGAAEPWRAAVRRHDEAKAARREAEGERDRAQSVHAQAETALDELDLEFAALVERTVHNGTRLLHRLQAEFDLACRHRGVPSVQLTRPVLPTAAELIDRSFNPPRALAVRPVLAAEPPVAPAPPRPARMYFVPEDPQGGGGAPDAGHDTPADDLWADPAGDAAEPAPPVPEDDRPVGFSWFDDDDPEDLT